MIDERFAALIRAAFNAQQAREGEEYQRLTAELADVDRQVEALRERRETAMTALEAMDAAIERTKDDLDAYFAQQAEPAESQKSDGGFGAYLDSLEVPAQPQIDGDNELFDNHFQANGADPESEFYGARNSGAQ